MIRKSVVMAVMLALVTSGFVSTDAAELDENNPLKTESIETNNTEKVEEKNYEETSDDKKTNNLESVDKSIEEVLDNSDNLSENDDMNQYKDESIDEESFNNVQDGDLERDIHEGTAESGMDTRAMLEKSKIAYTTEIIGNFDKPNVYSVGNTKNPRITYDGNIAFKAYLVMTGTKLASFNETIKFTSSNGVESLNNVRNEGTVLSEGRLAFNLYETILVDVTDLINKNGKGVYDFEIEDLFKEHGNVTLVVYEKSEDISVKYSRIDWFDAVVKGSGNTATEYKSLLPKDGDVSLFGANGAMEGGYESSSINILQNGANVGQFEDIGGPTTLESYKNCTDSYCGDGFRPIIGSPGIRPWSSKVNAFNTESLLVTSDLSGQFWQTYQGIYFEAAKVNTFTQSADVEKVKAGETITFTFEINGEEIDRDDNVVVLTSKFDDPIFKNALISDASILNGKYISGDIKNGLKLIVDKGKTARISVSVQVAKDISEDNGKIISNIGTLLVEKMDLVDEYVLQSTVEIEYAKETEDIIEFKDDKKPDNENLPNTGTDNILMNIGLLGILLGLLALVIDKRQSSN